MARIASEVAPRVRGRRDLRKRIEAVRLPDEPAPAVFEVEVPLAGLRRGEHPIHVCVRQEDGHRAWSSPIYLVRR